MGLPHRSLGSKRLSVSLMIEWMVLLLWWVMEVEGDGHGTLYCGPQCRRSVLAMRRVCDWFWIFVVRMSEMNGSYWPMLMMWMGQLNVLR